MLSPRTLTVAIAILLFTLLTCTPAKPPAPAAAPHPDVVLGSTPPPMTTINGFNLPPPGQAPIFPTDIVGGAPTATITEAAMFAWNEFIAATWPAQPNGSGGYNRDTPDQNSLYGQNANSAGGAPLVWETFRHKVEIFPGTYTLNTGSGSGYNPANNQPPHGATQGAPTFGYNDPPQYDYTPGIVTGPCNGTPTPAPWVNADENSQIFLTYMYAGAAGGMDAPPAQPGQQILFMAKANHVHYQYTVNPATVGATQLSQALWNHGPFTAGAMPTSDNVAYSAAVQNFTTYANTLNAMQPPPTQPVSVPALMTPYISFPAGTIEVKSAWRALTTAEVSSNRFHMATARNYTFQSMDNNGNVYSCYSDDAYGLLALHIIQKTPTAPYFIYATFSQADNIQTAGGQPVEDADGNIIVSNPGPNLDTGLAPGPLNPEMATLATATPSTLESYNTATNQPNPNNPPQAQCAPGSRLYIQNIGNYQPNGIICVDQRSHSIPSDVIAVNQAAHQAITTYQQQYAPGQPNPWLYYKLVNVQASPIDKPPGVLYSGPVPGTYYQSNDVVETNFNLQNFSGRLVADAPVYGTLMSDYADDPSNPPGFNSTIAFKNTFYLHTSTGTSVQPYNMGGCMGCHGNAQQAGDDFSFIMNVGRNNAPEPRLTASQIMAMNGTTPAAADVSMKKINKFSLPQHAVPGH